MAQQAIPMPPMANIDNFWFQPALIAAIDRRCYQAGILGRSITLTLIQSGNHIFVNESADVFNKWFLSLYSNLT